MCTDKSCITNLYAYGLVTSQTAKKFFLLGTAWTVQICTEKSSFPTQEGQKVEKDVYVQIWTFHAIPGKQCFCNLTLYPMGCERLEKMCFLCNYEQFMQFLAKNVFVTYSPPQPHRLEGRKRELFVQIWIYHAIPSKICILQMDPHTKPQGLKVEENYFLCRSGHFIQFLAKIILQLKHPFPLLWEFGKRLPFCAYVDFSFSS